MNKRANVLASVVCLTSFGACAVADEIGHGTDGPNAVPTDPTPTTESTGSFWDGLLETFDLSVEE